MEGQNNLNTKRYGTRLWIASAALVLFCFIAWQVQTGQTTAFDTAVDYAVYGLRGDVTNAILTRLTHLGDARTVTGVLLVLVILPQTRRIGVPATAAGIGIMAFYKVMKPAFGRMRPDEDLRLIVEGGYSFPSGHSMNVIVFYGLIIFLVRRTVENKRTANIITVLMAILIFSIGFSRIFVGVHYVSDVLGGWSFGIAYLMVATVILDQEKISRLYCRRR